MLLEAGGGEARLVAKVWHKQETEVFNFEVERTHNYFVRGLGGDSDGVLVHNSCKIQGGPFKVLEQDGDAVHMVADLKEGGQLVSSHLPRPVRSHLQQPVAELEIANRPFPTTDPKHRSGTPSFSVSHNGPRSTRSAWETAADGFPDSNYGTLGFVYNGCAFKTRRIIDPST